MIIDETIDTTNESQLSIVFHCVDKSRVFRKGLFIWNIVRDFIIISFRGPEEWHHTTSLETHKACCNSAYASTEKSFSYKPIYIIPKLEVGFHLIDYYPLR